MEDLLVWWKYPRTPVFMNPHFDNISIAQALPDVLHDHSVPCSAHLFTSLEALHTVKANHHHDLLKDKVMTQHSPVWIVLWGHLSLKYLEMINILIREGLRIANFTKSWIERVVKWNKTLILKIKKVIQHFVFPFDYFDLWNLFHHI